MCRRSSSSVRWPDASGTIVASISVTSTDVYTDEARMREVIPLVQSVARKISAQLGAMTP